LQPSTVAYLDDAGSRCGALSMNSSPPRLRLAVATVDGEAKHTLLLGDTFVVGGRTWRFEDVVFYSSGDWTAELRYVPPGAPPYQPPAEPRDYVQVELQSFGTVDEAGIRQLEQDLDRRLPPGFRMWLAHNNGAAPAEGVWIPGIFATLSPFHPILGVHPDEFHRDIRFGQHQAGRWYTDQYVVIAVGLSGTFAVGVEPAVLDSIFMIRDDDAFQLSSQYAARGYSSEAEFLCAEHLYRVASGIGQFCADLRPMPELPPATALEW
jgi:hypothetical protein